MDSPDVGLEPTLAGEVAQAAATTTALPTGNARYLRGRELGRGGMGRVCEAVDQQFRRVVAIKEVSAHAPSEAAQRRFTTEALVTGHLEHPGIPSVYERGVDDEGRPFYAMRRVEGRTFARLLAEAPSADERLALLPVVVRIAQTLGFAHDRGVVHRDVKPDNVLVGEHGETVVLDWGLARVRGVPTEGSSGGLPSDGGLTSYGDAIGTPAYMAPEQARGDLDRIDERSDVFALGGLLYHLLTGHPPFQGATVAEILDAARTGRREPLAQTAPRALAAICDKAMAREPAQRYRDAHELARALETFQSDAVRGRPSRAIEIGANLIAVLAIALALVGAVFVTSIVAGMHSQGRGGWATLAFGATGSAVLALEWATRGRYRLSSLGLALAGATFLCAVASFATGESRSVEALAESPLVADDKASRAILLEGLWESIGVIATGASLAAFQLLLWAFAQRRRS